MFFQCLYRPLLFRSLSFSPSLTHAHTLLLYQRAYSSPEVLNLEKLCPVSVRIDPFSFALSLSLPLSHIHTHFQSYHRAYASPEVLNLEELCILAGKTCWILYVDILVLGKMQGYILQRYVLNKRYPLTPESISLDDCRDEDPTFFSMDPDPA